jgi:hypothetical protein
MRIWSGLLCVSIALAAAQCLAQEAAGTDPKPPVGAESPPAKNKPPAATAGTAPGTGSSTFDIKYLEGEDGRPVAVPDKATLAEFLKWLEERESPEGPPAAAVASLEFDGTVTEDRILLTAQVEVVVTRETGWVRVPISLPEATLRDAPSHKGPGGAVPGPWQADTGYTWWLSGRGTHVLTLPLSVPILKLATQNRVQVTLPATAARSKLTLRIDAPRVLAKVPESSTLKSSTVGQATMLDVIGLGSRLDLAWQVQPDTQPLDTGLEVVTTAVATLVDGEALTFDVSQRIQSLGQQGMFEELRVLLPADCELLRLEGREHRDHHPDAANPRQIIVQLKKPTAGPIELKWTVRSKLPPVGETITLEGFDVDRARLQTGHLAVVVVGDFRAVPEDNKFLQRIDQAELPGAVRQVPAKVAYRFLNHLLLRMKLLRIEPQVTIDPSGVLYFSNEVTEFEGLFRLQVLRGTIASFRLRWPNWKEQGWTITEVELPGHIDVRPKEDAGQPDLLRLDLMEPTRGTAEVRIHARRKSAGKAESQSFTLPVPESAHPFFTRLAVVTADNVEVDLQPAESTLMHQLSGPATRIPIPREWQALRRADYRFDSAKTDMAATLSVHARKIQAHCDVEATIRGGAVTIRQKFLFDVAYERIGQLRFSVPEGVTPEQLKFFLGGDRKLAVLFVDVPDGTGMEARVTLDAPLIGPFEIEVRYALSGLPPVIGTQPRKLSIPLIRSLHEGTSETRLTARDLAARDVALDEPGWVRSLAADGTPQWGIADTPPAVALSVAQTGGSLNRQQVTKAFLRSVVTDNGTIENRAQFRLSEGLAELTVGWPGNQGITDVEFWWNRVELVPGPATVAADGTFFHEIVIPDRAVSADRLLTINYRSRVGQANRLGSGYSLPAPRLPEDLRIGQVYWQIEIPFKEHLFTDPVGFAPENHWKFGRFFWTRDPDLSDLDLQQWAGTAAGPPPLAVHTKVNRYLFATAADVPPLEFRTLKIWSLTVIGAGIALGIGFVLLRWPALRHAATLLVAVFIVALVAVWNPGPVLVMSQPAVLGIGLALLTAGIQIYQERRKGPQLVSLAGASGISAVPSSHAHGSGLPIGSNDYTSLRTPADLAAGTGHASSELAGRVVDSGSRL